MLTEMLRVLLLVGCGVVHGVLAMRVSVLFLGLRAWTGWARCLGRSLFRGLAAWTLLA